MSRGRFILVIMVLAASLLLDRHVLHASQTGIDFDVFKRASEDPADLVYRDHVAPFAYPPTALLLMKPLSALGYWAWIAISAALFVLALAPLARGRIAALTMISPPAVKNLVQGQSAMLLSAMMFGGLLLPPLAGGALWGIAASVKPQLMLFAPAALLVRRNWSMLGGMALGGVAMIIASLLLLDHSLWLRWIGALANFNGIIDAGEMPKVVSPAGFAALNGWPAMPFLLGGMALGLAAVVIAAPKANPAQLIALVIGASLVASPYAHSYDTLAMIPACAALMLNGRWIYAIPCAFIFVGQSSTTMVSMIFILVVVMIETRSGARFDLGNLLRPGPAKPSSSN